MRSRISSCMRAFSLLLSFAVFLCAPIHAQETTAQSAITVEAVDAAVEQLKADPNLATERKMRVPRWNDTPDREREGGAFEWLIDLARWIASVSRVLAWVVIGLLIVLLALYLTRFVRSLQPTRGAREAPPTHVRELDIRPESLPDDVGAAAWALWERNEHRPALSLLYRGLLSRLVHEWDAPIRESSTEGDCVSLSQQHLPQARTEFVRRLVGQWQSAVYGGRIPHAQDVRALCDEFASALAPERAGAASGAAP